MCKNLRVPRYRNLSGRYLCVRQAEAARRFPFARPPPQGALGEVEVPRSIRVTRVAERHRFNSSGGAVRVFGHSQALAGVGRAEGLEQRHRLDGVARGGVLQPFGRCAHPPRLRRRRTTRQRLEALGVSCERFERRSSSSRGLDDVLARDRAPRPCALPRDARHTRTRIVGDQRRAFTHLRECAHPLEWQATKRDIQDALPFHISSLTSIKDVIREKSRERLSHSFFRVRTQRARTRTRSREGNRHTSFGSLKAPLLLSLSLEEEEEEDVRERAFAGAHQARWAAPARARLESPQSSPSRPRTRRLGRAPTRRAWPPAS